MKLYYSPGACSLSPHIVLRESGLPFEAEKVDIRAKKTESGQDYWAINPKGYVPALRLDDGTVLTEGPAIVQYIADKAPQAHLAPANGTLERYRLQEWLNFLSTEIHKTFSPLFSSTYPEDLKKANREKLADRFKPLDAHLQRHAFLMGDQFSVADAYLFTLLNWCGWTQVDLGPWQHLRAYQGRVGERPHVKEALKAEGLLK